MEDKILEILMELKEGQTRLEGKFDTLEGRFDTLEGRFDTLEGRFDTLEAKVDKMAIDLESVKEQTADLVEFKTETTASLAKINENIDFLALKEHQAEKEIFSIKRKLENNFKQQH